MHITVSFRSVPSCLGNSSSVGLIDDGPFSSFQRLFLIHAAQCACICPACTVSSRSLLNSGTVDAADYMSCVKTVMAAPISNQFRVGSASFLAAVRTVRICLLQHQDQLHVIKCCRQLHAVYINNLLKEDCRTLPVSTSLLQMIEGVMSSAFCLLVVF